VPTTDEWIKKVWYIYTMEYYSAIRNNDMGLKVKVCNWRTDFVFGPGAFIL
jgi:hypothetical protein